MQLGARMDRGPVAPGMETLACSRRARADGGFVYVKMRDGGQRSLFSVHVAADTAQWAGPSVPVPVTVHPGAEFGGRAPAPQSNRAQPGPHLPTKFCDKAHSACGMDRARGGPPAERDVPDAGHDALKSAASSRGPDKMRAATRSGSLRPAARPGALDRWAY